MSSSDTYVAVCCGLLLAGRGAGGLIRARGRGSRPAGKVVLWSRSRRGQRSANPTSVLAGTCGLVTGIHARPQTASVCVGAGVEGETRWDRSGRLLDVMVGDPVWELDFERGERCVPVERLAPSGFGFGDREVQQLAGCFFGREVPSGLDDLADLAVQRLDRVGRVDHAADVLGVGQERGDLLPALKPALADRRVAGIPLVGEALQLVGGVVGLAAV